MSSLDWISTNGLKALAQAGASFLQMAEQAKSSEHCDEEAEAENAGLALEAETDEQPAKEGTKPASKPIDQNAVNSAKSTVSAVMAIADVILKLEDLKTLSTFSLSDVFGDALKVDKPKEGDVGVVSADNKLRVARVNDTNRFGDDFAKGFESFDRFSGKLEVTNIFEDAGEARLPAASPSPKPGHRDVTKECAAGVVSKGAIEALEKDISYTNERGERTTITGEQGKVRIVTTDSSGKVISEVSKTSEQTDVTYLGETARRTADGAIEFKAQGFRVLVKDGIRRVFIDDHRELIRHGGTAIIRDHKGAQPKDFLIEAGQLQSVLDSGIPLTLCHKHDDLEILTREVQKKLKQDEMAILVIKDAGVRTIFGSGVIMDVRPDHTARIRTKDGTVFIMDKDGRIFLEQDGSSSPLDHNNLPKNITYDHATGKFKLGDVELNPAQVSIIAQQLKIDLGNGRSTYTGTNGRKTTVHNRTDGSTEVQDGDTVIDNQGEKVKVKSRSTPDSEILIDLVKNEIETKDFIDRKDGLTVKETGTEINDKSVNFGGGRGPTLYNDGSVRVDDRTTVSASGSVHSEASAEGKASSAANDGAAKAANVYGKALGGTVRTSDVAALSGALGDVVGLMGTVLPGSVAYARLMVSYNQICSAINFATPKAHAAEVAISKGVTDETSIKHVQDNLLGATAEQAVEREQLEQKSPNSAVEFVPKGYWLEIKTAS